MTELMLDLDIEIMAIVTDDWNPVNGKRAMIKATNGSQLMIKAIDKIEGLLFGCVVDAAVKDLQGQEITNDEVQKSCHNYQRKIMTKGFRVDLNHDKKELEGVELVENYVDRRKELHSHEIVLNFKENEMLMEKAKNSTIKGLSPAGKYNVLTKAEDTEKGIIKKAIEVITEHFKPKELNKSEEIEMTKDDIKNLNDEQLKEWGLQKIVEVKEVTEEKVVEKAVQETSKAPEKETSKAPEVDLEKAIQEGIEKAIKPLQAELELVKSARATGDKELTKIPSTEGMTNEQLEKARLEDPEAYEKMLEAEAEKRK